MKYGNKDMIIEAVREKTGLTGRKSLIAIDSVLRTISEAMASGERVTIRKFGIFSTRKKNARMARNPKNGDPHMVEARTVPWFNSGKVLKDKTWGQNAGK